MARNGQADARHVTEWDRWLSQQERDYQKSEVHPYWMETVFLREVSVGHMAEVFAEDDHIKQQLAEALNDAVELINEGERRQFYIMPVYHRLCYANAWQAEWRRLKYGKDDPVARALAIAKELNIGVRQGKFHAIIAVQMLTGGDVSHRAIAKICKAQGIPCPKCRDECGSARKEFIKRESKRFNGGKTLVKKKLLERGIPIPARTKRKR